VIAVTSGVRVGTAAPINSMRELPLLLDTQTFPLGSQPILVGQISLRTMGQLLLRANTRD
jgi:hypothetical protein